jgi:hypothetical protein
MTIDEIFFESYQRCSIGDEFIEGFLSDFCVKNPRFKERFAKVDVERQAKMLKASIILVFNAKGSAAVRNTLADLAIRHKEMNLDILENEFDLWVDSLVSTVAKHDPIFDPAIENAWRETLKTGLLIMKQGSCLRNES